jgi:hypothetical protein
MPINFLETARGTGTAKRSLRSRPSDDLCSANITLLTTIKAYGATQS